MTASRPKLSHGRLAPWEKVGYLNVVKCVTKANNGQWSKVPPSEKKTIMENCQGYLVEQMLLYKPQLIVAYGKPACDWFGKYSTPPPRNYGSSTISIEDKSRIVSSAIAFVYQKHGGHFNPDEMGKIRGAIVSAFKSLLRERY